MSGRSPNAAERRRRRRERRLDEATDSDDEDNDSSDSDSSSTSSSNDDGGSSSASTNSTPGNADQRSGRDDTSETRESVTGETSPSGNDMGEEDAEATDESTTVDRGPTDDRSERQSEQRQGRDGTNQTRETVSGTTSPTGNDAGTEDAETTGRSLRQRTVDRIAQRRDQIAAAVSRSVENRSGVDVDQGEDFSIEERTIEGRSPSGAERQRAQQLRDLGYDERADDYLAEETAPQRVSEANFTDDSEAEVQQALATQELERRLEEEYDRDVEPGEDFTVEGTEDGFQANPTESFERELFREQLMARDDVDSEDDFEITQEDGELQAEIQPQRPEEEFIEGVFSGVDDVIDPAVTSFEAQSGVDVPGEGALVTTSDTGSPDQISSGARDLAGVENTTSVSEVADEALGQTDDDARQQREEASQSLTGEQSPYNVVDNLVEGFDSDREPLPIMQEFMSEDELSEFEENQPRGAAPGFAASAGPGGAARGAAGASRLVGSSDDLLRGLGITGAAAGAGVASQEVDVPEQDNQGELEVAESVGVTEVEVPEVTSTSEIAIPENAGSQGEVGVGETVSQNEITVPDRTSDQGVTASPVVQGELGQQSEQEEQDIREVTEEDIASELPEPEQRGPSVREQQRRDDLYSPERTFPTGESAVVGQGMAGSYNRVEQSQQPLVNQESDVAFGQQPRTRNYPISGFEERQEQSSEQFQDPLQDTGLEQQQQQNQSLNQFQEVVPQIEMFQSTTTASQPETANPNEFENPNNPEFNFDGAVTTPNRSRGRRPRFGDGESTTDIDEDIFSTNSVTFDTGVVQSLEEVSDDSESDRSRSSVDDVLNDLDDLF